MGILGDRLNIVVASRTNAAIELAVTSYSVYRLTDTDPDVRQWSVRRDEVVRKIRELSPDIFGVQEAKLAQVRISHSVSR